MGLTLVSYATVKLVKNYVAAITTLFASVYISEVSMGLQKTRPKFQTIDMEMIPSV